MGLVTLPDFGADPVSITGPGLDAKVNPLATEFNGGIDNDNIASDAAIAYSKLNLALAILNADISASAGIVASKLDLSPVEQTLQMSGAAINAAKGSDIASATTTDIGAATGNTVDVTGTTTITGLGSVQAGVIRHVQFDGALTLTHNATSLILPGGANITTAAGDNALFQSEGSGNWRCIAYTKASGLPTVHSAPSGTTIQTQITKSSAVATDSGTAVDDDSIPTLTECPVIAALNTAITASSTSNTLIITCVLNVSIAASVDVGIAALFLDGGSAAIAAARFAPDFGSADAADTITIQFSTTAADTSAHTYKIGLGGVNGVITLNGEGGNRLLGGVLYSSMMIQEIKA